MAEKTRVQIPYRPHPAQSQFHSDRSRFRVLACGARFGKDRACVNDVIKWCLAMASEPHRADLIPRVNAWYIAPTYPLAQQMWAELVHFTRPLKPRLNKSDRVVSLPGGVEIKIKSGYDPDSLVAEGVDYAVMTEASLLAEEVWEKNVRTRLASPGRGPGGLGGLAAFNSTPRGRNWFWRAFLRGRDQSNRDWRSFHFPTASNPHIRREEIEAAQRDMPDRWFRQEFLAEFLDDGGGVFKGVRKLLRVVPWPCAWNYTRYCVAGIDWGRHHDFCAVTVLDASVNPRPLLAMDRWTGLSYEQSVNRVKRFLEPWKPAIVVPEANAIGDPLVEELVRDLPWTVSPFVTTAVSKRQIIESLALRCEQGGLVIPARIDSGFLVDLNGDPMLEPVAEFEQLVCELEAYEYKVTRAGTVTYSAPANLYDDCVISLALADHGSMGGPPRIEAVGSTTDFSQMIPGALSGPPLPPDWRNVYGR